MRFIKAANVVVLSTIALASLILGCGTLFFGCGGPSSVTITIPKEMQTKFQKAAPAGKYAFYVMKTAVPSKVYELSSKKLFVVCSKGMDPFAGIYVAASSIETIGTPLFKSSQYYAVSQNLRSPSADEPGVTDSVTTEMKSQNGSKTFTFATEGFGYGQSTKESTLFKQCIEEIKKNPLSSVLMCKQGVSFPGRKDMVELRFQ